jgi:hybrid cluster-associated redox disulfide protein
LRERKERLWQPDYHKTGKRDAMETMMITPNLIVADLLNRYPQVVPVLLRHGMSCVGCSMSIFETLHDAAKIYGIKLDTLITEIEGAVMDEPTKTPAENPILKKEDMTAPATPSTSAAAAPSHTYFPNLSETVSSIPHESIVSRTIYRDSGLKAIVFAFAPGQELSEHTASVPAIIQIIEGECELTVGESRYEASAGAWVQMPAKMPHSLYAKTPVKMLLMMIS